MPIHPNFADGVKAMAAPNADQAVIDDILGSQDLLAEFGVNTPRRIAHFLSQVGHESGGFNVRVEKMSYTAPRLMEVWPKRFPTLEFALQFERNAEKLGNFVYANRMGNGDPASGDGFRYRGRGLLQLTGRQMYRETGRLVGLPLEEQPELAESAQDALKIACGAWQFDRVDKLADTASVEEYTQRINGGQTGIDDRKLRFTRVCGAMGIAP